MKRQKRNIHIPNSKPSIENPKSKPSIEKVIKDFYSFQEATQFLEGLTGSSNNVQGTLSYLQMTFKEITENLNQLENEKQIKLKKKEEMKKELDRVKREIKELQKKKDQQRQNEKSKRKTSPSPLSSQFRSPQTPSFPNKIYTQKSSQAKTNLFQESPKHKQRSAFSKLIAETNVFVENNLDPEMEDKRILDDIEELEKYAKIIQQYAKKKQDQRNTRKENRQTQ